MRRLSAHFPGYEFKIFTDPGIDLDRYRGVLPIDKFEFLYGYSLYELGTLASESTAYFGSEGGVSHFLAFCSSKRFVFYHPSFSNGDYQIWRVDQFSSVIDFYFWHHCFRIHQAMLSVSLWMRI